MGREVAQGLVGTDGIVDTFPMPQFAIEWVDFQRA